MAKKVYAIQCGFDSKNNKKIENVIVKTWAECLLYVKGVKGSKYKSFENIDEAYAYLNEGNRMLKKNDDNYPKDCLQAYVDGSYNVSDERYSYGLVCVKDQIIEYIESGAEKDTSEKNIRQIAGELKGAIKAVEYALKQGENKIVIFHDYEGIAHHATGAWARRESSSMVYYEKMQELMKCGIEIIFVKVDSHTGDLFNELVDEKCKECLGISSDNTVQKYLALDKIKVSSEEVKKEVLSIASNNPSNIVVIGNGVEYNREENNINKEIIKDKSENEFLEENKNIEFEKLTDLYKTNEKEARKKISKMLSKDKEKYILYLLNFK